MVNIMVTDTIAAIATGMTDAGISIIRVSGENAVSVVDSIFRAKSGKKLTVQKSHTLHFGTIYDEDTMVDEVLVSIMLAPKSYTGENTVEINCHGGMYLVNHILSIVLKKGARLAQPGEFTKRAFLNGKIDLSKAEAIMDLISSKNDFAMRNSMKQLKGNVYHGIKSLREKILYEIAYIESALDDPEHYDLSGYPEELALKVDDFMKQINNLMRVSKNGKIRKDGISTVIIGKPNAGKSSFLNLLTGEERAIVTSTAGTTRDILEETIKIDDMILNVIDTAGIRKTEDEIEKIGVEKAKKYATDADLILYMVDASTPISEEDKEIIQLIQNSKVIVLMNKSDLDSVVSENDINDLFKKSMEQQIVHISAKNREGLGTFSDLLREMFFSGNIICNEDIVITNTRQLNELNECLESLQLVKNSIEDGMPEDFFSIDLNNAYLHLGFIIGEEMNDDVVNEIFSKFCMGK